MFLKPEVRKVIAQGEPRTDTKPIHNPLIESLRAPFYVVLRKESELRDDPGHEHLDVSAQSFRLRAPPAPPGGVLFTLTGSGCHPLPFV